MTIHKEGYTPIALCILFIFVANALIQFYFPAATTVKWVVYILSLVAFISTLFIYRSPGIHIQANAQVALSPADGKITAIDEVEFPAFIKGRAIRVSIAILPINAHVTRNPVSGAVQYLNYDTDHKHTTLAIENASGITTMLRQSAGPLAQRVITYVKEGDTVNQGEQLGFGSLGARVDVFLPANTKMHVDTHDMVKAGSSILAELKA